MAKINGVEVKAVKTFKDHEGCSISQGNVYVDGKKVGSWSQDAWGGQDSFDGCEELIKERAEMLKEGCDKGSKYYDFQNEPDIFMNNLMKLMEDEKQYKKAKKNGYKTILLVSDGFHINGLMIRDKMAPKEVKSRYSNTIKEYKSKMFKNVYIDVRSYSSDSDFNLTIDKDHLAPDWINN